MANTIDTQTLNDGPRNVTLHVHILGDGSAEETATTLVDVSSLSESPSRVKIHRVQANLTGFSMNLLWDATTDDEFLQIPANDQFEQDYREIGGLQNPLSTGATGDINFTTLGLGLGDKGTVTLWLKKT